MSQGTVIHQRFSDKDFTVGTPEEFVRRFNGTRVINKVRNNFYNIVYRLRVVFYYNQWD